jgi:hypothetical protein
MLRCDLIMAFDVLYFASGWDQRHPLFCGDNTRFGKANHAGSLAKTVLQ